MISRAVVHADRGAERPFLFVSSGDREGGRGEPLLRDLYAAGWSTSLRGSAIPPLMAEAEGWVVVLDGATPAGRVAMGAGTVGGALVEPVATPEPRWSELAELHGEVVVVVIDGALDFLDQPATVRALLRSGGLAIARLPVRRVAAEAADPLSSVLSMRAGTPEATDFAPRLSWPASRRLSGLLIGPLACLLINLQVDQPRRAAGFLETLEGYGLPRRQTPMTATSDLPRVADVSYLLWRSQVLLARHLRWSDSRGETRDVEPLLFDRVLLDDRFLRAAASSMAVVIVNAPGMTAPSRQALDAAAASGSMLAFSVVGLRV